MLDGELRASTESDTTAFTYRWHTRRLLQGIPAAYLGIQFVLGLSADHGVKVHLPLTEKVDLEGVFDRIHQVGEKRQAP